MSQFVSIPPSTLAEVVAQGRERDAAYPSRICPEYFAAIFPIRLVFWQRLRMLHGLMKRYAPKARNCLDFGGGGGVFTPSLAATFEQVTLLDLGTMEADILKSHYNLDNVELLEADATAIDLGPGRFDVVVAADVLEHFKDLDAALDPILRWIADDGILITSLPTETLTYEMLRFIFRTKKPEDHYHRAADVERHMQQRGFERIKRRYAPLLTPIFPLYYISAWRKVRS